MDKETPKVEAPVADYDAMSSVFDSLVTPDSSTPKGDGDGGASTPVDEAAATAKVVDTPPGETSPAESAPVDGVPAEAAATPEGGVPAAAPAAGGEQEIDWKAKFEALERERAAAPPAAAAPAAAAPAAPAVKETPIYAPDEEEFLSTYDKEWPDVIKGEALKRRREYAQLVDHVFSEVARVYGPMAQRGVQAAETVAENAALAVIQYTHKDYDDSMYEAVHDWVDNTLTGTRQKIAKAIVSEGDPSEVVELITEFKTATGRGKPAVVAAGAPPAAPVSPKVTEISAAAKKAAKALGVVESKRSSPTSNVTDPDDFDSAWNEAVGTSK